MTINKIVSIILLFFFMACHASAEDYFKEVGKYENPADNWGYWRTVMWKANKKGFNNRYRYYTHVSNREYLDCRGYKGRDCRNPEFGRCWECKDYYYGYRDLTKE